MYLDEENLRHILNDPNRIFHGEETHFQFRPKNSVFLSPKGAKNIYVVDKRLLKQLQTVMFTFSAAGAITPPMIIYLYKRLPQEIISSVPPEWGFGKSDNGRMTRKVLYKYVSMVSYPHLKKIVPNFQLCILFMDRHSTRLTMEVSLLCKRLGIVLVAIYPSPSYN